MTNTKLQSYHIFLFPFKWEFTEDKKNLSFSERTETAKFLELLGVKKEYSPPQQAKLHQGWQHDPFNLNRADKYNEFTYFYDYVREILYDFDTDLQVTNYEQSQVHLEYRLPKDTTYNIQVIKIKDEKPIEEYPKTYKLPLESVLLNIYNSGVGILSFHLSNATYFEEQEILDINQYGRRLFPPFLGSFNEKEYVQRTKEVELAASISIEPLGKLFEEDFGFYDRLEYFKKGPFRLPNFIGGLFEGKPVYAINDPTDKHFKRITISPVLDDRMFVLSWCQNKQRIDALAKPENLFFKNPKNKDSKIIAEANDLWYKYLFIDAGDANCGDEKLFQSLLQNHTYRRWLVPDWGSAYGVSRYSFVAMMTDDNGFRHHVTGMYYKMVELCLLQRASVLRFSDEITHVSKLEREDKEYAQKVIDEVRSLYNSYIHFVNRVYFREVTAQEQGIELYDLLQDKMRIERHVKELESEMRELHQYALLIEEENKKENDEKRVRQGEMLNLIAFILLPATVVAGIFGFSTIDNSFRFFRGTLDPNFWGPFIIAIIASFLGWAYYKFIIKKRS